MGGTLAEDAPIEDTTATINLRAAPPPPPTQPQGASTSTSRAGMSRTATMPTDLLTRDEAARTNVFARLMVTLAATGVPLAPLLQLDATARIVFAVTVVLVALTYSYIYWISSAVERYSARKLGLASQVAVLAANGLAYVFGMYSAAPAITALALYALALSGNFRWCFVTYLASALSHAGLALAIHAGVVPDHAMIPADTLSPRNQLLCMACIQAVYLLAFLQGRWSRAKTVSALAELELAMRQVAERDALLAEVHRRMDAMAAPGQPGRFTGHQLGSFRLGPLLGKGGMGEVYDAIRVGSGEPAAVKLLARHALTVPTKVTRFLRELEVARTLRAPNIAQVLEVGDLGADLPFLAMEKLEGADLDHRLRHAGRLAPAEVAVMVDQLACGLAAAHAAGIIHRDLKPSNVFRTEAGGRPLWKILDFGVSKLLGDSQLTQDAVVGTPAFMAPEQAKGHEVTVRTDVYGLAVVAYAALTGVAPFGGGPAAVVLGRVVHDTPRPPGELVPLPPAVDRVLATGMAKNPADRYPSPAALAAALATALADA